MPLPCKGGLKKIGGSRLRRESRGALSAAADSCPCASSGYAYLVSSIRLSRAAYFEPYLSRIDCVAL